MREIEPGPPQEVPVHEDISLAELEAARWREVEWLLARPEPHLREQGEQKRQQLIERLAAQTERALQPKIAAKVERSSRKSPMRAKIVDVMREARRVWSFDAFLERWLADPYDELEIAEDDDRYVVEDIRAGGEARYTRAALRNLWTEAGK